MGNLAGKSASLVCRSSPLVKEDLADMITGAYHDLVVNLLARIESTQANALSEAARLIKQALDEGGVLHAFSTGHSHMMVEEMFYRAGGLVPVNPIFDPGTMLHQGVLRSTGFERLSGYAAVLLQDVETRPGEPIVIVSNSGGNPVPVEMALLAKQRGLKVIAITSKSISSHLKSRFPSGEKLMDVADILIDNCIEDSDAAIEIDDSGQRAGGLSSIAGIYIIQRLILEVIAEFLKENELPPIFASANVLGGDESNLRLINRYKSRVRAL